MVGYRRRRIGAEQGNILMTTTTKKKKRKLPVKIEKIELEDEWEGWWFVGRVNPKMQVFGKMMTGVYDDMVDSLADLLIEWNFVDENGGEMPQPNTVREAYDTYLDNGTGEESPLAPRDLMGQLTIDLIIASVKAISKRIQEVPGN